MECTISIDVTHLGLVIFHISENIDLTINYS